MKDMNYDSEVLELLAQSEELKVEGEHDRAIGILEQIILSDPMCFEAFEELGDNYLSLRELDKAEKALAQSVKINPDSSNGHYLLGFLSSLQEHWKHSVSLLEKADALSPNHPEILRCLGWAFYNSNRKSQGISVLERSRNLNPYDPNILCDLGVCYMNSQQFDGAEETFNDALKIDPNSEQAKECLMMLAMLKGGLTIEALEDKDDEVKG